jgi:hypothetical protein
LYFQAIKKLLGKKEVDKNSEVNKKLLKAAKILERMVNQNTYNEIAQGEMKYSGPVDYISCLTLGFNHPFHL